MRLDCGNKIFKLKAYTVICVLLMVFKNYIHSPSNGKIILLSSLLYPLYLLKVLDEKHANELLQNTCITQSAYCIPDDLVQDQPSTRNRYFHFPIEAQQNMFPVIAKSSLGTIQEVKSAIVNYSIKFSIPGRFLRPKPWDQCILSGDCWP